MYLNSIHSVVNSQTFNNVAEHNVAKHAVDKIIEDAKKFFKDNSKDNSIVLQDKDNSKDNSIVLQDKEIKFTERYPSSGNNIPTSPLWKRRNLNNSSTLKQLEIYKREPDPLELIRYDDIDSAKVRPPLKVPN